MGGAGYLPAPPDFIINGMNVETALLLYCAYYEVFGPDVALEVAMEWIPTAAWAKYTKAGGPAYAVETLWGQAYYAEVHGQDVFYN